MSLKKPNTGSRRAVVQQQADFSRDISLLTSIADERTQLLIKLFLQTGLTPAELVSLRKTDLEPQHATLNIRSENTKNGIARTATLSQRLARQLVSHTNKNKSEYLFSTRQSPKLTTRRVEQLIAKACKDAKTAKINPRDLREAYLKAAASIAKDDDELKALTGLKSITKQKTLSEKETRRLVATTKKQASRTKTLITLLLETGIKLNEALALQRKHLKQHELQLPNRKIAISTQLFAQLTALEKKPEEHLFTSRQRDQLTTRRAEQLISNTGAKAKLELTAQRLRATALKRIAEKKGPTTAQAQSGNKTTLRYRHGIISSRGGGT